MTKQEKAEKIIEDYLKGSNLFVENNCYHDLDLTELVEFVIDYDKKKVKTIEERKELFSNALDGFAGGGEGLYEDSMINDFFEYWTEHGENDKKMRFEKEKSFGLSRRLKTWERNSKKFNNERNSNNQSRFEGFVEIT